MFSVNFLTKGLHETLELLSVNGPTSILIELAESWLDIVVEDLSVKLSALVDDVSDTFRIILDLHLEDRVVTELLSGKVSHTLRMDNSGNWGDVVMAPELGLHLVFILLISNAIGDDEVELVESLAFLELVES